VDRLAHGARALAGARRPLRQRRQWQRRGLRCEALELRTVSPASTIWMLGYPQVSKLMNQFEVDVDQPPIGEGSYGVVRLARDKRTGKEYALKIVKKMVSRNDRSLKNLHNEARIIHHLGPSLDVAYCYGIWEDAHSVQILTEYCRGGDILATARPGGGRRSEAEVASVVRSVLRVVALCHANNIAHRDIKPDNFLFLSEQTFSPTRAIDFGLATYMESGCDLTDRCGTVHYCAPEVINQSYGLEADLWSVGVLAYQLLTGKLPFGGGPNFTKTREEVYEAILHQELDFETEEWDLVSNDAKDFVRSLLTRSRSDRPTSLEALQHRWIRDREVSQLPVNASVVQRLQRFSTYGSFKQLVMQSMARELSEDDAQVRELREIFCEMDPDGDGAVKPQEMRAILSKAGYYVSKDEFKQLVRCMEQLCATSTGSIGRTDKKRSDEGLILIDGFVAALIDWRKVCGNGRWDELTVRTFEKWDRSGCGMVDLAFLSDSLSALNGDRLGSTKLLESQLRAACSNGGKILTMDDFLGIIKPDHISDNLDLFDCRYQEVVPDVCAHWCDGEQEDEDVGRNSASQGWNSIVAE